MGVIVSYLSRNPWLRSKEKQFFHIIFFIYFYISISMGMWKPLFWEITTSWCTLYKCIAKRWFPSQNQRGNKAGKGIPGSIRIMGHRLHWQGASPSYLQLAWIFRSNMRDSKKDILENVRLHRDHACKCSKARLVYEADLSVVHVRWSIRRGYRERGWKKMWAFSTTTIFQVREKDAEGTSSQT